MRVAGPSTNSNPYRRDDDSPTDPSDHHAQRAAPQAEGDEEWEWVYEGPEETHDDAPDGEATRDSGPAVDADDSDDDTRSGRRDDNDLFRI